MKIKITTAMIYFQKNARFNQLKNNQRNSFYSMIMLTFGEAKTTKEKFHAAK